MKRLIQVVVFALGALLFAHPSQAIELCGSGKRYTCVVDGDTLWLEGEKIRLQGFDTPETTTNICGGQNEVILGRKAAQRLVELLKQDGHTIQRSGKDRYGRTLATIYLDGVDIGEILIAERLARRWPDGPEFWCQ